MDAAKRKHNKLLPLAAIILVTGTLFSWLFSPRLWKPRDAVELSPPLDSASSSGSESPSSRVVQAPMTDDMIISARPLSIPFETQSPFLFAVHHLDFYPSGKPDMSVDSSLAGRAIGRDFGNADWNMYHGTTVPGFPEHPHRGFETVTVCRKGLVDHHDSLGCSGRFGGGDAQWMTAGKGVAHSEMFPCVVQDGPNTLDLFQIWLNLPARSKMVEPYFTMFWAEDIPHAVFDDGKVAVSTVAGQIDGMDRPPTPPPESWAHDPSNEVAIWTVAIAPEGSWVLPTASQGVTRSLFLFTEGNLQVGSRTFRAKTSISLDATVPTRIANVGKSDLEVLILQGKPIAEPVAQYGPFVMNTQQELQQAFEDYRAGRFGTWPWGREDPVAPLGEGRFARYQDGHIERPHWSA